MSTDFNPAELPTRRAMKRLGTFGNYTMVTQLNEHLLTDSKMVEVEVAQYPKGHENAGRWFEPNASLRDFTNSNNATIIVAEATKVRMQLQSLIVAATKLKGGPEALSQAGFELEDNVIDPDSPVARSKANDDAQIAKHKALRELEEANRQAALGNNDPVATNVVTGEEVNVTAVSTSTDPLPEEVDPATLLASDDPDPAPGSAEEDALLNQMVNETDNSEDEI